MIIIEGRAGKSRVLEKILNTISGFNRNIAVIDTVGVKGLVVPDGTDHFSTFSRYNYTDAINIYNTGWFESYDWIVFEINADVDNFDLSILKKLEKNSNKNFVVTIRNNSLKDVCVKMDSD